MDNSNNLKGEEWRPVVGYEGLYEVSNLGRIRSLDRVIRSKNNSTAIRRGITMKTNVNKQGYLFVVLSNNGKRKLHKIHRIVAEAFIPNPNNFKCVHHVDENKLNPEANNLIWCTIKHNVRDYRLRRSHKLARYNLDGYLEKSYLLISDVEEDGFDRSAVKRCIDGRAKQSGGKMWKEYTDTPLDRIESYNGTYQQKRQIIQINSQGDILRIWESGQAAIKAGFTGATKCANGKYEYSNGYKWRWAS